MKNTISIIDLLKIDVEVLASKNSNFAIYTGISQQNIPIGTVFNSLLDKDSGIRINAFFKIELITVLGKEADFVLKGYNAVLFISSEIDRDYIASYIGLNEKGNLKNVCYLLN